MGKIMMIIGIVLIVLSLTVTLYFTEGLLSAVLFLGALLLLIGFVIYLLF